VTMPAEPETQSKSFFKIPRCTPLRPSSSLCLLWLDFLSRWYENRAIESRAKEQRTQKQQEQDRIALEQFGGKELAIQNFYATPRGPSRRNSSDLLWRCQRQDCDFGASIQSRLPSYSRCVDVKPTKTTTYTLTIADASGNTKTQTLEVKVR